MRVQMEITFDQLVKVVKALPFGQLQRLKVKIGNVAKTDKSVNLETLLLNGPTATKKQLEVVGKNRKAINQWRTK